MLILRKALAPLVGALVWGTLTGCQPGSVTPIQAREIADHRFLAHSKMQGNDSGLVPQPEIDNRAGDTVFKYIEPKSRRTVTVIIGSHGEVADTIE